MLAPVLGSGEIVAPVMVAAADPLAWTRAPLFVVQSSGSVSVAPVHHEGEQVVASTATPARDQSAIAPVADGLFVGRNRSEEHTSELKSLMSISYDGFCLQTQNH